MCVGVIVEHRRQRVEKLGEKDFKVTSRHLILCVNLLNIQLQLIDSKIFHVSKSWELGPGKYEQLCSGTGD